MSTTTTGQPPFHRLLSFYAHRSPYPDTNTIRLQDSLHGNLALGLDFPAALAIALGRHLYLRNTSSWFSLNIHVPSVPTRTTLLEGLEVEDGRGYTCGELVREVRRQSLGWTSQMDAVGVWALAADVRTGVVGAGDVRAFLQGGLLGEVEGRRKWGRGEVLPLWRGGPISVAGHSWFVKTLFGVDVYRVDGEKKQD